MPSLRLSFQLFCIGIFAMLSVSAGCDDEFDRLCPSRLTDCDSVCVDTKLDANNCGACDKKCPTGQLCSASKCAVGCLGGATECSGKCINLQNDPGNCGACATTCKSGEVCTAGKCALSCVGGTTICSGKCVDTLLDPRNCGACKTTCTASQVCSAGKCGLKCAGGTIACSGKCIDILNDPANCGGCKIACASGLVCSAGKCALTCLGGTTDCGGKCANTLYNPSHCGVCGSACKTGEVCSAGKCKPSCAGGTTDCSGKCVDTLLDPANCGGCAKACKTGEVCAAGKCGIKCLGGATACSSKCVDTKLDPANCGGCAKACKTGEVCSAGKCGLNCVGGTTACSSKCVDTQNDPKNCGSCAKACKTLEVCSTGACLTSCSGGLTLCSNTCIDTQVNPSHCGSCGKVCTASQYCSKGTCFCLKNCSVTQGQGGTLADTAAKLARDSAGNLYIAGAFSGTIKLGGTTLTSSAKRDMYVAKLDSNGNVLWAVSGGGTEDDGAANVAVDASGNVYVTGVLWATATFGSTTLTSGGSVDIMVAKLDKDGKWLWAKKAGGTKWVSPAGLALDKTGNLYVGGVVVGTAKFGSITINSAGSGDPIVAKMTPAGTFAWVAQAKGSGNAGTKAVAVNSTGDIYFTGASLSSQKFGSYTVSGGSQTNIWLAKLNSSGVYQWAIGETGSGGHASYGLVLDAAGNAYVGGQFKGTAKFGSKSVTNSGSKKDFLVAKASAAGVWQWASRVQVSDDCMTRDMAIDGSGNLYITGQYKGSITAGGATITSAGVNDVPVIKLDSTGKVTRLSSGGGTGNDWGGGIVTDSAGNAWVTGADVGSATFGSKTLTSAGDADIFIWKIDKDACNAG